MAEGRYNVAWSRLSDLSAGGDGGEVDYQLGLCELYRGHRAAAMVAWERAAGYAVRRARPCRAPC